MALDRVFKQSFLYLVGTVGRRAIGFLMIPIYTRFLTPSDYGIIELIELLVTIATTTCGLAALSDSAVRTYYDYSERRDRNRVFSTAALVAALVSGGLVLAAALLAPVVCRWVFGGEQYVSLIRACFVAMFFGNMLELALVYQRLRQRAGFYVAYSLAQLAATLALNIYFIAVLRWGVWGFIWSKLICTGAGCVLLSALLVREVGLGFSGTALRKMTRLGGPLVATSLSFFVIHFVDRFFLDRYADLASVGVYSLGYKFGFLITYVIGEPFFSAWGVTSFSYASGPAWKSEFARVGRYFFFFLVLGALGLGLFSPEVLRLMSAPSFWGAAAVIPVVAVGYVFREAGDFFFNMLLINKRAWRLGTIALTCGATNLALDWWWIRAHGMMGAAWATLGTWLVYMILCWRAAHREYAAPFPGKAFLQVSAIASALFLGASATKSWPIPATAKWGLNGATLAIFLLFTWFTAYFAPEERDLIGSRVREQWRRVRSAAAGM